MNNKYNIVSINAISFKKFSLSNHNFRNLISNLQVINKAGEKKISPKFSFSSISFHKIFSFVHFCRRNCGTWIMRGMSRPARICIIRILGRCRHKCVRIFGKKASAGGRKRLYSSSYEASPSSLHATRDKTGGWRKGSKKIRPSPQRRPHSRYSSNFSRRNIHERCCGSLPVPLRFYSLYHPVGRWEAVQMRGRWERKRDARWTIVCPEVENEPKDKEREG